MTIRPYLAIMHGNLTKSANFNYYIFSAIGFKNRSLLSYLEIDHLATVVAVMIYAFTESYFFQANNISTNCGFTIKKRKS